MNQSQPPQRESAVDRMIREATERGEFDNLRGQGKPIPGLGARREDNAWLKSFLEREKISMPLPGSLQLRKDAAEILDSLAGVRSEQQAREMVETLNERIRDSHRHRLDGPVVHVNLLDVDQVIADWKRRAVS